MKHYPLAGDFTTHWQETVLMRFISFISSEALLSFARNSAKGKILFACDADISHHDLPALSDVVVPNSSLSTRLCQIKLNVRNRTPRNVNYKIFQIVPLHSVIFQNSTLTM